MAFKSAIGAMLLVETVFAMHEGPRPWKDVVRLVGTSPG